MNVRNVLLAAALCVALVSGVLVGGGLRGARTTAADSGAVAKAPVVVTRADATVPPPAESGAPTHRTMPVDPSPPPTPSPSPTATPTAAEPAAPSAETSASVVRWAGEFAQAHADGDLEYLMDTLHPVVAEAYGAQVCADYVDATMGSIGEIVITEVSFDAYVFPTPASAEAFPEALGVEAQWTVTTSGMRQTVDFHLIPTPAGLRWLTTCGHDKATIDA